MTRSPSICLNRFAWWLFELLTQSYEAWRKNNPSDSSAGPLFIEAREFAQRKALFRRPNKCWELSFRTQAPE